MHLGTVVNDRLWAIAGLVNSVEAINITNKLTFTGTQWQFVGNITGYPQRELNSVGVAALGKLIFVVGGIYYDSFTTNKVHVIDSVTNNISIFAHSLPDISGRSNIPVMFVGDTIYGFGGTLVCCQSGFTTQSSWLTLNMLRYYVHYHTIFPEK